MSLQWTFSVPPCEILGFNCMTIKKEGEKYENDLFLGDVVCGCGRMRGRRV